MATKINLQQHAARTTTPYQVHKVADIDEHHAFVVAFEGTFPWHEHDGDEFFLVLEGHLRVEFQGELQATTLGPMDTLCVPRGVVHQTVAPRRARALVFERQNVTRKTLA